MRFDRHLALGAVLAVALALRIGFVLHLPADDAAIDSLPDQREYLQLGRNLLAGGGLQFTDRRFDQVVWAYRMPGYPLLVAACGGNVRAIRLVQAIVDAGTVVGVYFLAINWLVEPLALAAAAIAAVNPLLVYFSGLILSETLFVAMLVWGMVLLLRPDARSFVGSALLALAVLVRPSAILLPVLLPLASCAKRALPLAAASFGMTLLVLFPWGLRNHARLGAWIWTTTNSGITEYDGFNPDATGASDQSFVRDMPQLRGMGEVERSRYLSGVAGQFILAHPGACLKLAILKIGRMWSPVPLSAEFGRPLYVAAGLAYSVPLLGLSLLGLIRARLSGAARTMLLVPAIYFTVVHAVSVSSLRYRLPAEPQLAVLAAAAFTGRTKSS